jgi:hypothetical protein
VLGIAGKLVHLRGAGVQWNPADHLCVAAQVLCAETAGDTWTLSGDIHAVEPRGMQPCHRSRAWPEARCVPATRWRPARGGAGGPVIRLRAAGR